MLAVWFDARRDGWVLPGCRYPACVGVWGGNGSGFGDMPMRSSGMLRNASRGSPTVMSRLRERAAGKGKTIGTCRRSLSANGPGDGTFLAFPSAAAFSGAVCRGAALAMGHPPGARSTRRSLNEAVQHVGDGPGSGCSALPDRALARAVCPSGPKTWGTRRCAACGCGALSAGGVWQSRGAAALPFPRSATIPGNPGHKQCDRKTRFSIQIG